MLGRLFRRSLGTAQIPAIRQANIGGAVLASAVALGISTAVVATVLSDAPEGTILDEHGRHHEQLSPTEFRTVKLLKSKQITHDTKLLRFQLPKDCALNHPVPSNVVLRAVTYDVDECFPFGKLVERPYTVVSLPEKTGHFDLIVKCYPTPHGDMSQFLHHLERSQSIQVKGPVGVSAQPASNNSVAAPTWEGRTHLGMVAGGSGVTPMIQMVRRTLQQNHRRRAAEGERVRIPLLGNSIARPSSDTEEAEVAAADVDVDHETTSISLLVSDKTVDDVIFFKELERLAEDHRTELSVYHTLTRVAPSGWTQGCGRITKEMVHDHLPEPSPSTLIMIAGPNGLVEHLVGSPDRKSFAVNPMGGLLGEMGYTKSMVFVH